MADTEQVNLKEARETQAVANRAAKGIETAPAPDKDIPATLEEVAASIGLTVTEFAEKFGTVPSSAVVAQTPTIIVNPTVERRPGDTRQQDIARRKDLLEKYKAEPRVQINISPMYAPWVGRRMPMSINGIFIYINSDGLNHEVPESFADLWFERKTYIDKMFRQMSGMSQVQSNAEAEPGELIF